MHHTSNIFDDQSKTHFYNCTKIVHALPYEPFVISKTSGLEIDILKELGKHLNISFDIRIHPETKTYLGNKLPNGSWSGFVQPIFESWHMGIGSIAPEADFINDFAFSVGYYMEDIIFIVPIANLIPRWRVMMAIFTLEIWGICLAIIVAFAILFYISKGKREVVTFRTFPRCLTVAFQMLVAVPVPIQPRNELPRVFFISLALLAIIISSVYTSSLIFYLQNPIREHQILTWAEIVSVLGIGGPPQYKELFISSPNPKAKLILDKYQTVNETMDSFMYWLNLTANDRSIATFAIKLCVSYLLSKNDPVVTDRYGNPKVVLLRRPLMTQTIGVMMRRGSYVEGKMNALIQKLIIEAGLVEQLKLHYTRQNKLEWPTSDMKNDDYSGSNNAIAPLTTYHLEGAFAILGLGYFLGFTVFLLENLHYKMYKK